MPELKYCADVNTSLFNHFSDSSKISSCVNHFQFLASGPAFFKCRINEEINHVNGQNYIQQVEFIFDDCSIIIVQPASMDIQAIMIHLAYWLEFSVVLIPVVDLLAEEFDDFPPCFFVYFQASNDCIDVFEPIKLLLPLSVA